MSGVLRQVENSASDLIVLFETQHRLPIADRGLRGSAEMPSVPLRAGRFVYSSLQEVLDTVSAYSYPMFFFGVYHTGVVWMCFPGFNFIDL